MKKYYKSQKYRKYHKRHSEKQFNKRKNRNHRKQHYEYNNNIVYEYDKRITVPDNFCFISNTSEVIKVINELKKSITDRLSTYINLENVNDIDNGAITILLALMAKFRENNIFFNGGMPSNDVAKQKLLSSGFFEYLSDRNKNIDLYDKISVFDKNSKNQITTTVGIGESVYPDIAGKICETSAQTIGYTGETSKGLYRTIIELMQNTHNHASSDNEQQETWWLTANHDLANKKVEFVFFDFGVGIFKSLEIRTTPLSGLYKLLKIELTDAQILEKILKGEVHKTKTELNYRGKGLPGIYEVNMRNQINNLYMITNNVFANINSDEYKIINEEFNGTFLYWEIDEESEVNEWKK